VVIIALWTRHLGDREGVNAQKKKWLSFRPDRQDWVAGSVEADRPEDEAVSQ
jgi:hypothetical protein